jgi:hypothetical protein
MSVRLQSSTYRARMLVRNKTDLEVYSSKHPYIELMKLVYENVAVPRVLIVFPTYIHLLANSWYCRQLKSLMLVSHITDSMGQSPSWEANRSSGNQEIYHILWYPKICYRIQKYPPPLPILSQFQSMASHPTSLTTVWILSFHYS